MAKYYGSIGYAKTEETSPGVYTTETVERKYSGDILRNTGSWAVSSESTNDDLDINVQISIVADPYAYKHFHQMKYIVFMGAKWKIKSIEPRYPRIIVTVGGVYNGQQT